MIGLVCRGYHSDSSGHHPALLADLFGKVVRSGKNPAGETVGLDLRDLPAGVYLLRVMAGGRVYGTSVVVR
jgi:hypothetical protein